MKPFDTTSSRRPRRTNPQACSVKRTPENATAQAYQETSKTLTTPTNPQRGWCRSWCTTKGPQRRTSIKARQAAETSTLPICRALPTGQSAWEGRCPCRTPSSCERSWRRSESSWKAPRSRGSSCRNHLDLEPIAYLRLVVRPTGSGGVWQIGHSRGQSSKRVLWKGSQYSRLAAFVDDDEFRVGTIAAATGEALGWAIWP